MGLLMTMQLSEAASLLLGLLFGVIIILFVVISVLLIYSLLLISVESKTFETGVLRMVGMSKANCISMILIQSMTFVIPSIVFGYVVSIPVLMQIYAFLLTGSVDINITPVPTAGATVSAVALGLTIPVVSSIIPIMTAMNKNLGDSLSATRSLTKGVKVAIEEQNSFASKAPYLLFGSLAALSGIAIYYLLPYAIVNLNLGLLLNIFFMILLGMILGLTLIASNF